MDAFLRKTAELFAEGEALSVTLRPAKTLLTLETHVYDVG